MPADRCKITVDASREDGYEFRGDVRRFFSSRDMHVICAGPADSGKTLASCLKMFVMCAKYPKTQGALIRKTYRSIAGSVALTFDRVAKGFPVVKYGGEHPEQYQFWNGSRIWIGGMDAPDKVLSSERDFIYVNQSEELTVQDWETLATRCTGRGAVMPYTQLLGDCNPSGTRHWIRKKASDGKLRLFNARHTDNPSLYDSLSPETAFRMFPNGPPRVEFDVDGEKICMSPIMRDGRVYVLSAEGRKRLEALATTLSGVRLLRLFKGIWATAEGAVYDRFDATPGGPHVRVRDRSEFVRFVMCGDEGYTNPQVNLLVGIDTDGRWHVLAEFYVTHRLEQEIVAQALGWWREYGCDLMAMDEAAAGLIAALNATEIKCVGGKGGILDGIRKIQGRLAIAGDGRSRLTVDPSCVNTVNEFESYQWKPEKDVPLDKDNHAVGALRYLADALDEPSGAVSEEAVGGIVVPRPELATEVPLRL